MLLLTYMLSVFLDLTQFLLILLDSEYLLKAVIIMNGQSTGQCWVNAKKGKQVTVMACTIGAQTAAGENLDSNIVKSHLITGLCTYLHQYLALWQTQ